MRVYVESYGCAQNQGEGRTIARSLQEAGHALASHSEGADVGILVTCGVIGSTEARMFRRWQELSYQLPKVIVTGCLVPLRTDQLVGPGRERTRFVPIREQHRLPALLLEWAEQQPLSEPPLVVPSLVETPPKTAYEEVVVSQGCTSHCSYCFSRLARGRLTSVPLPEVVERVRKAVGRGVAEVRLTSLDTSCWGMDLPGGERLPQLLQYVAQVPGEFKVRLGMLSPQSLSPIRQELFEALQLVKFFRFLHLPVQSGSNAILDAMRREYTVEDFRELVRFGRELCPELTVATDIIVGYPGETETDFELTCRLIEELGPEIVNVTRFSARPMTPAARLPLLPPRVAKRRSRRLTELRMQVARVRFERWVGREEEALIVEHGPDGSAVGRLFNYLPVVLPDRLPLGSTWRVRVDGARSTYLLGEPTGVVREASGPP